MKYQVIALDFVKDGKHIAPTQYSVLGSDEKVTILTPPMDLGEAASVVQALTAHKRVTRISAASVKNSGG